MVDRFQVLSVPTNLTYSDLLQDLDLETIRDGRQQTTLVCLTPTGLVPLVRSTTSCKYPAQPIKPVHAQLMAEILSQLELAGVSTSFNHIMLERYSSDYRKMRYHSDQALDLAEDSYIAIFSRYPVPPFPGRELQLVIRTKANPQYEQIIPLTDRSLIYFSVADNRLYQHKLVLKSDQQLAVPDQPWLGLTMRCARTLLRFINEIPYFTDQQAMLVLATPTQAKECLSYRHAENTKTDFRYPILTYTLSVGDTLDPSQT
jgi:hypothetical protein